MHPPPPLPLRRGPVARVLLALAGTAIAAVTMASGPSSGSGAEGTAPCRMAANGMAFRFGENGSIAATSAAAPAGWAWGLSLRRFGSPLALEEADAIPAPAGGDRLEVRRGPLTGSFRCDSGGVEHRLEIQTATGPAGLMALEFRVSGSLVPKIADDGRTVRFRGRSGDPGVAARDLSVADAAGRDVGARWERIEGSPGGDSALQLLLDAEGHLFPLYVTMRFAPLKTASTAKAAASAAASATATPAEAGVRSVSIGAAAPLNDACQGAAIVPAGGPFPYLSPVFDLGDATATGDPPTPTCQPDVSHSVWFTFTPDLDGAYDFSVCSDAPAATTVEDTVMALYEAAAPCAGLSALAGGCSDDACGAGELQSGLYAVPLTAGRIYAIVVWTYGAAPPPVGMGEVQLRVDRLPPTGPPPANDRCEAPETIPPAGPFPYLSAITTDISGATSTGDPTLPSCQPNVSRSIWYRFVPVAGGRYAFSVCADAPTGSTLDDTVVAVYSTTGPCTGHQELPGGCDDDSCAGEPAQSRTGPMNLSAGVPYDIVVWKYGADAPAPGDTAVQLRVEQVTAPENDTCAAPASLPLDRPIAGTTVAALDDTRLSSGTSCFAGVGQTPSTAAGRDVAYRFTAPESGRYSFRVTPSEAAANFVAYTASACPGTAPPAVVPDCLAAANRSATQPEEVDGVALGAGQSILVFVDEDTATSGASFTIEANRCALESEPNGAPATAGILACLTEGSIAPAGDADFFALGTPAALSRVFAVVDGVAAASADFDLRVTTGTDTLEYDDFNNDAPFGSNAPNVSGTLLTGSAAYLRVSHYSPVSQSSPYRLCATVQPPASQAVAEVEPNDTLASATGGPGGYFAGLLGSAGDVDLFAFPAVPGELVQIGLDLDPLRDGTAFNGSLALLDGGGANLLVVNDASSAASTLTGAGSLAAAHPFSPGEALLYRIRTAGTHYARVALSSGIPGDYLLSIARHASASPDGDGDGTADAVDCAPADPAAWRSPGEATGLQFAPGSNALLEWSPPAAPGSQQIRFDLLRSSRADDWPSALCLAADTAGTSANDAAIPVTAFFYLVRSENACGGNLGTRSDGTPRAAASCP
jgi:hypothetical protein